MRNVLRLLLVGLVLAVVSGCGKKGASAPGKVHQQPARKIEDSVYIDVQARLSLLDKRSGVGETGAAVAGGATEDPEYKKSREDILKQFNVTLRDVEAHGKALEKSRDSARIQQVALAISEKMTDLEMGN